MFFFFNDTATTEIYTLSLHDALPISETAAALAHVVDSLLGRGTTATCERDGTRPLEAADVGVMVATDAQRSLTERSEEHTSELQSRQYLVCRLLLEKKKTHSTQTHHH